ncbi:MAG: hypothetical protein LRY68_09005 [Sulfurospirillum sp.]|nr:hypothetical protein [Sulfurospirillum sp.]
MAIFLLSITLLVESSINDFLSFIKPLFTKDKSLEDSSEKEITYVSSHEREELSLQERIKLDEESETTLENTLNEKIPLELEKEEEILKEEEPKKKPCTP